MKGRYDQNPQNCEKNHHVITSRCTYHWLFKRHWTVCSEDAATAKLSRYCERSKARGRSTIARFGLGCCSNRCQRSPKYRCRGGRNTKTHQREALRTFQQWSLRPTWCGRGS